MSRPRAWRIGVEINPHIIGGTERFLRALFTYLDRARFAPVAIASAAGRWQSFLAGVAETHIVPYVATSGEPADVAAALRRCELDLVQSSYFSPVLALAAAQAGIPHVWRMGGHVDAIERDWSAREKKHLLTIVCFTACRVICGSRFLRSQFDDVGTDSVEVIPNGIDLKEIPIPAEAQDRSDLRVAMVAHLVPQKRHETFLRALPLVAAHVPRARFVIFGGSSGTPELRVYEQSLQGLARGLGIDQLLEFRELRSDRFDTLRHVDLFAFPGVNEGASNAILEAMALGAPVVAARSGGNPELIEDGVSGILVPAEDPAALAAALLGLLQDPARLRTLGRAGRARVEGAFDMATCARRYEDLYARVLEPS